MTALVDALVARLDEWERVARQAHAAEWLVDGDDPGVILRPDRPGDDWDGFVIARLAEDDFGLVDHSNAAHIALNDPAWVLGVVGGLRAVVGLHVEDYHATGTGPEATGTCRVCVDWDEIGHDGPACAPWPCPTLVAVAGALGVEVGE